MEQQQQAEQTEFIVSLPNGAKHRFYKIPLGELSQPRSIQARQIDYFLDMLIQPNDISNTINDVLDILENEKSEPDNLKARLRAADKLKPIQDKLSITDNILRCKISKAFVVWALEGEPVQMFDSNWQSKKLDIIFASNEATAFFLGEAEILTNTDSTFTSDTLNALNKQIQVIRAIEKLMPSVQPT
jgi:hypothetical protein